MNDASSHDCVAAPEGILGFFRHFQPAALAQRLPLLSWRYVLMSFKLTILIASAVTSLAAAPVSADPQRGHAVVPPPHGGPKSVAPAAAPRPTTAPTTPATNPVAAKISTMPQLNAKITALLPPNMTLDAASAGFRNQGQFIAALHVSHNLGIPFTDLKSDMVTRHMSLGRSIQDLTKTADAPREAKKGEAQATSDLKTAKRSNR